MGCVMACLTDVYPLTGLFRRKKMKAKEISSTIGATRKMAAFVMLVFVVAVLVCIPVDESDATASDLSDSLDTNQDEVVAEEDATIVAYIDETPYYSFESAVAAAIEGNVIRLVDDVTITSPVEIDVGIEMDLGNNTIIIDLEGDSKSGLTFKSGESKLRNGNVVDKSAIGGSYGYNAVTVWDSGSKLEVTDITISQYISSVNEYNYGIRSLSGAELVLGSNTVINELSEGSGNLGLNVGVALLGDGVSTTKLTIDGATINTSGFAIAGNGSSDGTEIRFLSGTATSTEAVAVYHPQEGDMVVEDGTITGLGGIQYSGAGSLTINGGTITGTFRASEFPEKPSDQNDGSADDGAAISLVSRGDGYQEANDTISLEINGGTLISQNNAVITSYRLDYVNGAWVTGDATQGVSSYIGDVSIQGGSFIANGEKDPIEFEDGDAKRYEVSGGEFNKQINTRLLADDYELVESGGTYLPSYTPDPSTGGEVPVTIITSDGVEIGKASLQEAILSLQDGQTLRLNSDVSSSDVMNVVVERVTINLNGKTLTFERMGSLYNYGSMTITNGSIVQSGGDGIVNAGSLELSGVNLSGKPLISAGDGISLPIDPDVRVTLEIRDCTISSIVTSVIATIVTSVIATDTDIVLSGSTITVSDDESISYGIIAMGDSTVRIESGSFSYADSLIPTDEFWDSMGSSGWFLPFSGSLVVVGGTFNGGEASALADEFDGLRIASQTDSAVTYVSTSYGYAVTIPAQATTPGGDVPFPPIDDDDDYVPIPPVIDNSGSDDDTTTIVACAAAAVVAALMAVFLIMEYRKR